MGYADLVRKKAAKVVGIDCSTQSLAYAIFDDGEPVLCGEVFFEGSSIYERINDARIKTQQLVDDGILIGDYVGMEAAIGGKSVQTTIKLSYVYGAVLSVIMQNKMEVETVAPITWQTYIGNPNFKKAEKEQLAKDFPDRSKSWYDNKRREIRKARTLEFAKKFFTIESNSDNIGDAVGIAYYTSEELTRR